MTETDPVACISGYDQDLEEEIFQFQRLAYPARRADWIAPRWRWIFLASARRLAVEPMVWIYRNGSTIVGHNGGIPVKLKVGDEEYFTAWSVETMVLESMRGRGIGPMVFRKLHESLPLTLSVGQTPPMRSIMLGMGWQQVAPVATYVFVLDAVRLLSGKLGGKIPRRVAAAGLAALQRLRHSSGRLRLSWQAGVAEIDRFDDRHDRLWEAVKGEYACAVVRDTSYLNWKYVEQPGQQYLRLEVRRGDEVVAVAVLLIREPGSDYRYRRAFLVDLIVRPSDTEAVWASLEVVRSACSGREVDLIVFQLINEKLARLAARFGFMARPPERFLLLATDRAADHVRRQMLEASNWLVTMGDSDIDRPW